MTRSSLYRWRIRMMGALMVAGVVMYGVKWVVG
jgi:hypothetical protein